MPDTHATGARRDACWPCPSTGSCRSTDAGGAYRGTVTARAAAEALTDDDQPHQDDRRPRRTAQRVTAEQPLADAVQLLVAAQGTGLPVLDDTRTTLVGWLTYQNVLAALLPARLTVEGTLEVPTAGCVN